MSNVSRTNPFQAHRPPRAGDLVDYWVDLEAPRLALEKGDELVLGGRGLRERGRLIVVSGDDGTGNAP